MIYTKDDSTSLAFLNSKLTHIESKVFEVKYTSINYPNVVPISSEANEGATSVTYRTMDGRTVAKFIGSNAIDVPTSDIGMTETIVPVKLAAVGYQYSNEEIRQAILLNQPLSQLKANLARRGYEELVQRVCMEGDTTQGLPGFINNSNVTAANVVDPGSGTEWVNKTPAQILFDINDAFNDIRVDSLQNEEGNTLCLPTSQFGYIAGTPRSSTSDLTILAWIVNNSPYLNSKEDIISLNELAGAGAASTDRMVAYRKDREKLVLHIPMPLKFTEPQRAGLGWIVPGECKLSGVELYFPGSARYSDGI